MLKQVYLNHKKAKEDLYQKTANFVGDDFLLTYSLDNAEAQDLFYQMFLRNTNQA